MEVDPYMDAETQHWGSTTFHIGKKIATDGLWMMTPETKGIESDIGPRGEKMVV